VASGPPRERVTLIDEAGLERAFVLHDALDLDGFTYYLVEAADGAEEVLVLKEVGGQLESVAGDELARALGAFEEPDPS
jgi:hypothetical protein